MKEKILPLIIGILIGAIITAAGFMIYMQNNKGKRPDFDKFQQSTDGTRPELPNGEKPDGFPNRKDRKSNSENTTDATTNTTSNVQTEANT